MTDTAPPDINERILHRVRSLLAKAESSEFAEEAAAFTAKAHELMASHAIEHALLQERSGSAEVTSIRVVLPAPYAKDKCLLLSAVALGNRCRAVLGVEDKMGCIRDPELWDAISGGSRIATVFGYRSDLDVVEVLFTSLLLQASNVMLARGSVVTEWGENRTRAYRHAFLVGFASTIRQRLGESERQAATTADRSAEGEVLPVLADRSARVDDAIAKVFPNLGSFSTSISDGSGLAAGRAAASRADVGLGRFRGSQPQLGRG